MAPKPKLPPLGVHATVEGYASFMKRVDDMNRRIAEAGKKAKENAKNASPLSGVLDKVGLSYDTLKNKVAQFTGISPKAVDGINQIVQAVVSIPPAAALAVAGIGALAVGVLALGARGAPLRGLADSFDRLTASIGLSSKALLEDLRRAAAGTVSDFDLIRRANIALAGATGQFGQEFGRNLPKLLEIARVQARATGQDVDFLFQSIVTGIKRGSPLLIDNTGLVLKISEANAAYAEQLGKTVEQLTAEERQIAVLNATLAAGQVAIDTLGNAQETAAEKIARNQATITNIFDTLAVAVQPAYEAILDVVGGILSGIQSLVRGIAPVISFVAEIFQGILNLAGQFVGFIGRLLGGGEGGESLGSRLRAGAIAAFRPYADGIRTVITRIILPLITGLAKSIADFLIGQSPPPKGPLSEIDKGGENMMLAWLKGITGISLDPVEQVAAEVSASLGSIGKASLKQVEARLATLDKALLPFQQRLDIVKSRFDAIAEPAKAALEAIDRQVAEAEEGLASGDQAAAETIRHLDAQRAAIQANLDAQQAQVDQYQIQLALAQAQQSQERALLNIRKAQFNAVKKVTAATDKAHGAIKEPKPTGAAAPADLGGAASPALSLPTESVLDDLGGSGAFKESVAEFGLDLVGGEDAMVDFQLATANLQTQLGRFNNVNIGQSLLSKFSGITDIFNPDVENSLANRVRTLFGGSEVEGSIAYFIANLPASIESAASGLKTSVESALNNIFDPNIQGSPANIATRLFAGSEVEGSLAHFIAGLPTQIQTAAADVGTAIQTNIVDPINNFLTGTEPGQLGHIINQAVSFFTGLPQNISDALTSIGATLHASIVVPVVNMLNAMIGAVETGLRSLATSAIDAAAGVVGALGVLAPAELTEAVNTLRGSTNLISLPRIAVPAPPEAARGGVFSRGMLSVGERGRELIYNANKVGVIPHQLTKAILGLDQILAQPSPMMVPMGSNYNTTDNHSINANFYGVNSPQDVMRRMATLRARTR